jgi:hypothetical protein
MLLNASQEDLRLQRQQFEEERERQLRRAEVERGLFVARIEELERQAGGSRGGRGSRAGGSQRG